MDELVRTFTNTGSVHHAYACVGEKEVVQKKIELFLKDTLNVSPLGNPDVIALSIASFGIEDARQLESYARTKALSGKKFLIVSLTFITLEAQQALLKLLEEPTPGTHFFFIIRTRGVFIGTVRSRLQTLFFESAPAPKLAEEFLRASYKKRAEIIKPLVDAKDKEGAGALITALLHEGQQGLLNGTPTLSREVMADLCQVQRYLEAKNASPKMLLEYLSARVPRMVTA